MLRFVVPHLRDDGPRRSVALGQPRQVTRQVLLDLALGFDDEAQAPGIAGTPGCQAERKGTGVPQRVEQAGPVAEFAQALLGPGQVVGFFARGRGHLRAQGRRARGQRLGLVQRLGADLAHMIDAHQGAGEPPLVGRQLGARGGGWRALSACRPAQGPERGVRSGHPAIDD